MTHAPTLTRITIGNPTTKRGLAVYPLFDPEGRLRAAHERITTEVDDLLVAELPQPTITRLQVTNTGRQSVLLLPGTVLRGGHQNRMVSDTAVIPPGATVTVNALCVERGRWGGDTRFTPTRVIAPYEVRRAAQPRRRAPVAHTARPESAPQSNAQASVWNEISARQGAFGVQSPTGDLLESTQRRRPDLAPEEIENVIRRGPLPHQIGIAVSIDDHLLGVDLLGSPQLLVESWVGLIGSYVTTRRPPESTSPAADATLHLLRAAGRARWTSDLREGEVVLETISHRDVIGSITSSHNEFIHAHLAPTA